MKLVRLNYNKLKIFLTFDDLFEYGITVEDLKNDCLKVHSIIQRMVESACDEINFQMKGAIEIEIYSLHAQGLIMIITRDEDFFRFYDDDDDEIYDLKLFMEEQQQILYEFGDFEDIISLCKILERKSFSISSSIYHYNDLYFLHLENVNAHEYESVISVAAEYGVASTITIYRINEYGKILIENKAIEEINEYF